jgi:hypothetical protein
MGAMWVAASVCNETSLLHYLSSVYSVTIPLHVLNLLVTHHQVETMYICNNLYVLYVLVNCQQAWIPTRPANSQLRHTTCTSCCIYTLLPPDDGQLASPKHVEVWWLNKLKTNSASSWFHYMRMSRSTFNKNKNLAANYLFI